MLLGYIPASLLKMESMTEVLRYCCSKRALFETLENLLRDIFAILFLTGLEAPNVQVANLLKMTCLKKTYRTKF